MEDKEFDGLLEALQEILNKNEKSNKDFDKFGELLKTQLFKSLDYKLNFVCKNGQAKREVEGSTTALLFGLSDIVHTLYAKCNIDKDMIKECVQIGFDYKDKGVV